MQSFSSERELESSVRAKNMSVPHSSSRLRSVAPERPITKPTQSSGTSYTVRSVRRSVRSMYTGPVRCCMTKRT